MMEYVKNWNIGMDIKILLKTVGVVLKGSGSSDGLDRRDKENDIRMMICSGTGRGSCRCY